MNVVFAGQKVNLSLSVEAEGEVTWVVRGPFLLEYRNIGKDFSITPHNAGVYLIRAEYATGEGAVVSVHCSQLIIQAIPGDRVEHPDVELVMGEWTTSTPYPPSM